MDTEEKDDLDARLELRLGDELRKQLDQHVGRAAPYFLKRCAGDRDGRRVGHRRRVRLLAGLIAVAATLCAALVAWEQIRSLKGPTERRTEAVVALPAPTTGEQPVVAQKADDLRSNVAGGARRERNGGRAIEPARSLSSDRDPAPDGGQAIVAEPLILGHILKTRTRDEGTLLVGHTPVRKVRRQWLERVEWFDPQNGARVQRIVPREEILFVPLPIN